MKCTLKGLCVNPMWLPPTEEGMIEEDTHLETFLYLIVHYYGTEHLDTLLLFSLCLTFIKATN